MQAGVLTAPTIRAYIVLLAHDLPARAELVRRSFISLVRSAANFANETGMKIDLSIRIAAGASSAVV